MAIGSLYNANNVIVGQAAVFVGPAGTALPALAGWNVADPFDANFFANSNLVPIGATDQGWQLGFNKSTQVIQIEEQSTPVGTTITTQSVQISASSAEDVANSIALAVNGTKTVTANTANTGGFTEVNPTDTVLYYAAAMVTTNPAGFGRIVYAPKFTSLDNATWNARRAAEKRMWPLQFSTVCKPSEIRIIEFTSPPSA